MVDAWDGFSYDEVIASVPTVQPEAEEGVRVPRMGL